MPESRGRPPRRVQQAIVATPEPTIRHPTVAEFAKTDEFRSPATLGIGNLLSKAWERFEHADFFMSLNDDHFRNIYSVWSSSGWLVISLLSLAWGVYGYSRLKSGEATFNPKPTWSLVAAAGFVTFMAGALWAATSSGGVPQTIASHSMSDCSAVLDTSRLLTFRKDYKVALVCYVSNPTQDPLFDNNIAVSNLFTIIPGTITASAQSGPAVQAIAAPAEVPTQTPPPIPTVPAVNPPTASPNKEAFDAAAKAASGLPSPAMQVPQIIQVQMNFVTVLVPNGVERERIRSLHDLVSLGGKIVDPKYFE